MLDSDSSICSMNESTFNGVGLIVSAKLDATVSTDNMHRMEWQTRAKGGLQMTIGMQQAEVQVNMAILFV